MNLYVVLSTMAVDEEVDFTYNCFILNPLSLLELLLIRQDVIIMIQDSNSISLG